MSGSKRNINTDWAVDFRDIQNLYNNSMEEIQDELNSILSEPESAFTMKGSIFKKDIR